jgi:hypothetical protein
MGLLPVFQRGLVVCELGGGLGDLSERLSG